MIERQTIRGRPATVAYFNADWEPADKDDAPMVKVLFDDGEMLVLHAPKSDEKLAKSEPTVSMSDADYVDQSPWDADTRCGTCIMYLPRLGMMLGNCEKVAGDSSIDVRGWCKFYYLDED